MKYICLGYFDENKWERMSESERHAFGDYPFIARSTGKLSGVFIVDFGLRQTTIKCREQFNNK